MDRTALLSLPEEDLDEMVHDLKGQEAAEINNQGKEAQVAYILGEEEPRSVTDNPEPTIEECAEIGRRALVATGFSVAPDDLETSISDLVADLLHLARLNGIDPDHVIETAQIHFDAEVEERGSQV
ncbi:MAG: hypothetical protein AB1424_01965 [Thermodesulfobacteriota bacterium]